MFKKLTKEVSEKFHFPKFFNISRMHENYLATITDLYQILIRLFKREKVKT